ncbi:MAG TPA: YetF domain-containing protein [Candidatus Limnocylindrales bacterium]|nr:YetF domain-containing protein [Candidatus Limnocylindrales bacterium]
MIFDDLSAIWRTVLVGTLAYVGLVVFVRLAGKRTLGKMNAFDLIVTVALGSTLATILLSRDVALAEGLTAFAVLIGLQFVITWLSVRTNLVPSLVKSNPTLLSLRGRLLDDALRAQRVSRAEVLQAVRQRGRASLAEVYAVVLETDGSFSVITTPPDGEASAMTNVDGWREASD